MIAPGSKVIVTTPAGGVFFGTLVSKGPDKNIVLSQARLVLYWPAEIRGYLGLAVYGPLEGVILSPAAPIFEDSYTSIALCTDEAVRRFYEN